MSKEIIKIDDKIIKEDNEVKLYKLVATYKIK